MKVFNFISLVLIILSLILYQINFKSFEYFDTCYKDDESNKIIAEQNIFYDRDEVNISNVNCEKLCIIDSQNKMECITKEELFTLLNLPNFRKYNICVNGACMTNKEIKILNGKKPIDIQSFEETDDKGKITKEGKCLSVVNSNLTEHNYSIQKQFVTLKDCFIFSLEIINQPGNKMNGSNGEGFVLYFKDNNHGFHFYTSNSNSTKFQFIEKENGYILKINDDPTGEIKKIKGVDNLSGSNSVYMYFENDERGFHYTSSESEAVIFKLIPSGKGFIIQVLKDPLDRSEKGDMIFYKDNDSGFNKTSDMNSATIFKIKKYESNKNLHHKLYMHEGIPKYDIEKNDPLVLDINEDDFEGVTSAKHDIHK